MCSIGRRYFRQLCFNTGTDPCVIVLTMRQTLEDFARDLSTRLAGAGELLRNVVVLVRRKSSSAPMHNFAGQVAQYFFVLPSASTNSYGQAAVAIISGLHRHWGQCWHRASHK